MTELDRDSLLYACTYKYWFFSISVELRRVEIILSSFVQLFTNSNNELMVIWHYFFPIQMINMIVGFALLISSVKWYEIIISLPVATVFASLAILWGEELHGLERKWRILLLTTCCVFAGIAFILFILGVISGNVSCSIHSFPQTCSEW